MSDIFFYPYDSVTIWQCNSSPNRILKDWENYHMENRSRINSYENDCFDAYWVDQDVQSNFYFFFPLMPIWIDKVVSEFNNTFNNIKIVILNNKEVKFKPILDGYGGAKLIQATDGEIVLACPVFSIEISEKYNENVRIYLRYFVHHFLRMFSITHQYIDFNTNHKEGFIDYVIKLNNRMIIRNREYKILSEEPMETNKFLLMDNIDEINFRFGDDADVKKQTEIYMTIADESFAEFKVGDRVISKEDEFYGVKRIWTVLKTYRFYRYFKIERNGIEDTKYQDGYKLYEE